MKVHTDIERLPHFRQAVVTIGTFDGVHLGHQKIIEQLKAEAEKTGGETVIITFHPHPRKVVMNATHKIQLINTIEERIDLLAAAKVDNLVIVPFTPVFSELSPGQYVEEFLYARFKPAVVIIGYDHKFGKGRKGDYKLLEDYSAKGLFRLKEIPQHLINNSIVSSTSIRHFLSEGNIAGANEVLGYDFYFEGTVSRGDQRGRTIGFPTANLKIENEDKILPADGVYAVESVIGPAAQGPPSPVFKGMMNIGVRPTVDGSTKTIEVHLFDLAEDIYDRSLTVTVKARLRPEQKFSGLDELKQQLAKDKINALAKLKT